MARQHDFVRITLRLPPELHRRLDEVAAVKSINAEIVTRLERSFEEDEKTTPEAVAEAVTKLPPKAQQLVETLIEEMLKALAGETVEPRIRKRTRPAP